MKKISWILIVILLIILIAVLSIPKPEEEVIKIGGILPLSGDAATYGLPLQESMELAVEQINNASGIRGKNLKIIWEDTKCDGKEALVAAKKLIEIEDVHIIVGGGCSSEVLGIAPYSESKKIILISPVASSPDISTAGDFVFRTGPSDIARASINAQFIHDRGYNEVAILSENTDYGIAFKESFKNKFSELNGKIVEEQKFNTNDKDVKTQLLKIKKSEVKPLVLVSQSITTAGIIIKQYNELGMSNELFGNEAFFFSDTIKEFSQYYQGMYVPEIENVEDSQQYKNFQDSFRLSYKKNCDLNVYCASAYDVVYIIKQSIESCNEDNTGCIRDNLYNTNYNGASGNIKFDENGDPIKKFVIYQLVGNEFREIEEI